MSSIRHLLQLLLEHIRWIELFNIGFACVLLVGSNDQWWRLVVVVVLLIQLALVVSNLGHGVMMATLKAIEQRVKHRSAEDQVAAPGDPAPPAYRE